MSKIKDNHKQPSWLTDIIDKGYIPYIATSEHLLPHFNLKPFGIKLQTFTLEDSSAQPFLEAYLLSNSLSFKSPDFKMPGWVYVDCVLLQQAVVGFMKAKECFPKKMLDYFKKDPCIDYDALTHIPVSGQIDAQAPDGSLVNYSLFSLGREVDGVKNVGLYTKLLSLKANKAEGQDYRVIAQYDSPSIKVHGLVSATMYIEQPMVPLHPGKDMTFVLKMKVSDNIGHGADGTETAPTYWLNANDLAGKKSMQEGMANGNEYIIAPPYSVRRGNDILLPIIKQAKTLSL